MPKKRGIRVIIKTKFLQEWKRNVDFMSMMNDILANVFEIFSIVLNCDDSFRVSALTRRVG